MKQNNISFSQDRVASRARQLWEDANRPCGRDEEFWYRAENELRAEQSAARPPVMKPPRAATPLAPASSANEVPPPIRAAVKTPNRRPPRLNENRRPGKP